jgi:hypothetical protein
MMIRFLGNRRPAVVGVIFGTVFGLLIAVGYGATSAWLCSGIRKCPASWEPFAIVSTVIFGLVLVAAVVISMVGARAYKIFDTSIGGEKAYEPSVGTDIVEGGGGEG